MSHSSPCSLRNRGILIKKIHHAIIAVVSIATCIFIGWVVKPKTIIDEVTRNGERFGREKLYVMMVKYITPVLLALLLLQALGVITL